MRIAMLSAARSVHTARWANALAERGHTVALFSLASHAAPQGAYSEAVAVSYLPGRGAAGYWLGAKELRRRLAAFRPDILNAHYATGYGTLARRSGFAPLLLSVWGSDVYDFPYKNALNRRILQKNLAAATAVASTSRAMARQVGRVYRGKQPVFITPFGVDTDLFSPGGQRGDGALTVGTVKALEPKYGVEYLLRAFALLKNRLAAEGKTPPGGLRLEIYGKGSQLSALQSLARSLKIDGETGFHGAAPHRLVPEILRGFDIFCAASVSDSESFGVSAVEAMACDVPVVLSDVDGFREVAVHEKTGFIVPRRDFATLGNKLVLLAENPALRRKLGEQGRAHVLANYRWDNCVRRMEDALTDTYRMTRREKEAGGNDL